MFFKLYVTLWHEWKIIKRRWFVPILLTLTATVFFIFIIIIYGGSTIASTDKIKSSKLSHQKHYLKDILNNVEPINLWYAPYTTFTVDIVDRLRTKLKVKKEIEFESEENLEIIYRQRYYNDFRNETIVAIIFNDQDPNHLIYDLRIHKKEFSWNTDKLYASADTENNEAEESKYVTECFLGVQFAINEAFLETRFGGNLNIDISVQRFPDPPQIQQTPFNKMFMTYISAILIAICFISLCSSMLKNMIEEKTSGRRELMKIAGLKTWMLKLRWLIHGLINNLFSIVIIVILMKTAFWGLEHPIIQYCSGMVLFTFLLFYSMANIASYFIFSAIFSKASLGLFFALFFCILTYVIPLMILHSYEDMLKYRILLAIFPNVALQYGFDTIKAHQIRGIELNWDNLHESGNGIMDDISMLQVFVIFAVDIILFIFGAIYIENINPGLYGIKRPLCYPLYALLKAFRRSEQKSRSQDLHNQNVSIEIKNLKKCYGSNVIIDELSFEIYKNQITALLGDNGAGKSTLVSMIAEMTSATSGAIKIKNHNKIGFCPQELILFPELTAQEHLYFFAMIRGKSYSEEKKNIERILKTFSLANKKYQTISELSDSSKRKLSLAMALVGSPDILILDEPMAEIDLVNRRKFWCLLKKYKQKKTILFATQMLNEINTLVDRICIINKGHLQFCGTIKSLMKKHKMDNVYKFILKCKMLNKSILNKIKEKVFTISKDFTFVDKLGNTVVFKISTNDKNVPDLLRKLEDCQKDLKMTSIDVKQPDISDVLNTYNNSTSYEPSNSSTSVETGKGKNSFSSKLWEVLSKRIYFFKFKKHYYILSYTGSLLFFLMTLLLVYHAIKFNAHDGPALNLDLKVYREPLVYYNGPEIFMKHYKATILEENADAVHVENVSDAITEKGIENILFYKKKLIVAAEFQRSPDGRTSVNCLYSSNHLHSAPISLNLAMNSLAKMLLGSSITARNSPLKKIGNDYSPSEISEFKMAAFCCILIPLGFLTLMASFITCPNFDLSVDLIRIQLQRINSPLYYWISYLLFDYVLFVIQFSVIIIILIAINMGIFDIFGVQELGALAAIFYVYAFLNLPFTYVFSFKSNLTTGFSLYIIIGLSVAILTVVIEITKFSNDECYKMIATNLEIFLSCISSQFILFYSLIKFSRKFVENYNWENMETAKKMHVCSSNLNPCCESSTFDYDKCLIYKSYFSNENFGVSHDFLWALIPFTVWLVVSWSMVVVMESYNKQEETKSATGKHILVVKKLSKSINNEKAVKNISLSVKRGQCYGLLGVNGAGKTTLIRLLTSELLADEGTIKLNKSYCNNIAYSPRHVANYTITGRQLLTITATMKGLNNPEAVAEIIIHLFDLGDIADQRYDQYSGGNKKKLDTSLAFVGDPGMIILDEPTTGMDPSAKSKFWNIVNELKDEKEVSFVIASHDIKECEASSDCVGIMHHGEMKIETTLEERQKFVVLKVKFIKWSK